MRFSQDLEDLTEIIDGVIHFEEKIKNADEKTKFFIKSEFQNFIKNEEYKSPTFGCKSRKCYEQVLSFDIYRHIFSEYFGFNENKRTFRSK